MSLRKILDKILTLMSFKGVKALIFMALVFLASPCSFGEVARKWTEIESGNVIEGRMRDKKSDASEVQIEMFGGKLVWIKTDRLSDPDKDYINKWVKPVDHLTVRVVGSRKGGKTIQVNGNAGAKKIRIVVSRHSSDINPIIRNLKPGETCEFSADVGNEYAVKAFADGAMIDEESWNKKTGL